MRRGWLPASAARLRVNRGFDSAWYSDVHYGELVQRDWTLTKNAWSLITRASRSKPQQKLTLAQQIEDFKTMRYSGIKAAKEVSWPAPCLALQRRGDCSPQRTSFGPRHTRHTGKTIVSLCVRLCRLLKRRLRPRSAFKARITQTSEWPVSSRSICHTSQ